MAEPSLRAYIEDLMGGEDVLLRTIREEASEQGLPTIQVPLELGRLLALFIRQQHSQRILEIGTLFGYSAIVMARALPRGGKVTTLEVNSLHASVARRNLEKAGVADRVHILEGPALTTLRGMEGREADLVFIDADKDAYPEYLGEALRLTHPGSLIVADNVWRQGGAAHPSADDPGNAAIARFNRAIFADSRLFSAIIPTRDGSDAASVSLVLG